MHVSYVPVQCRYQQLQEVVLQLEQRNETLEGNFSELTQRLLQTQASEAELRDQLASALPGEKQEELENRISELAKSEAHLTISNNQLKEVAEVARQQAIAMETMQKSRDLELVSLRHQLLDLQSTNDEKTALGRVHHQLLSSQVSEAAALKNLEVADTKVETYSWLESAYYTLTWQTLKIHYSVTYSRILDSFFFFFSSIIV